MNTNNVFLGTCTDLDSHGDLDHDTDTVTMKVGDFGLAQLVEFSSLSSSNRVRGTPEYMSPELVWKMRDCFQDLTPRRSIREHGVSMSSDMWAYCCVVVEIFLGKTVAVCLEEFSMRSTFIRIPKVRGRVFPGAAAVAWTPEEWDGFLEHLGQLCSAANMPKGVFALVKNGLHPIASQRQDMSWALLQLEYERGSDAVPGSAEPRSPQPTARRGSRAGVSALTDIRRAASVPQPISR
mmetsp:Transcript_18199/g.39552  ORF Transcript_18199/g.39552 Transcript_18199/m.39552 type:complete len:237 (-) Transcript_18199:34-744(-)